MKEKSRLGRRGLWMVNYDGKTFSQLKLDFRVENVDFKRESVKSGINYGNVT